MTARSEPPPDLVGIGYACVDEILLVSQIPGPDAGARVLRKSRQGGGSVPNTLAAAAALGARTRFVGAFGDDEAGRFQLAELERAGVDASWAIIRPGMSSATCTILVDARDGARSFLSSRGDAWELEPSEIKPESFAGAKIVHLDSLDGWALESARLAAAAGAKVSCDPIVIAAGSRPIAPLEDFVSLVDYLIIAQAELECLLPGMDARRAAAKLEAMGAGLVVVTFGASGWAGRHQGRDLASAVIPVKALDTTGAGDAFRGAFLAGVLRGWQVDEALRFATAAAAACCARLGGREGIPSEEEILSALRAASSEKLV